MQPGISILPASPELAHSASTLPARSDPAFAPEKTPPMPAAETLRATARERRSQNERRDSEEAGQRKQITVDNALSQVSDLLHNVREAVRANIQGTGDNQLLLETAVSTLVDLISHTQVEGRSVFSQELQNKPIQHRQALQKYASLDLAYQQDIGKEDSPEVADMVRQASDLLLGKEGILQTLQHMAQAQSASSEIITQSLDGMIQRVAMFRSEMHPDLQGGAPMLSAGGVDFYV